MNASVKTPDYLLLFRGSDWWEGLAPEDMQRIGDQWMAWFNRLKDRGQALAGSPLQPTGKVLSGKNGHIVSDGPFTESKEAIGGYFLLRVTSEEEAVAIARECPGLPYGLKVEVRPVAERCPILDENTVEPALAGRD